jgi:hypothetical protein
MRTLAKGVREGSLRSLLVDLVALVHSNKRLDDPSRIDESHAWWDSMVIGSKPTVVSIIDSQICDVLITFFVDGYSDTSTI